MAELMRWRVARSAQRRIPAPESIVTLGGVYEITPGTLGKLKSLQGPADASNASFVSYSKILSNTTTLRQYLASATGAAGGVSSLDQWLASKENKPCVEELHQEITTLLGPYLPNSPEWQTLHKTLSELLYATLIQSAQEVNATFIEMEGSLTRQLLVVALVDTLQQNPSPIQTPDDVYAALRWRTLVLPDNIVQQLLAIRASNKAVTVRKPGFADFYVTREEWNHYEPAEIASIENILGRELKSRVHVLVNQTQVTTTTEQTTTTIKLQDTTTTDLTQLQQQSTSDISLAAHIDGQVDTTGVYGPTQVSTHIGGSLDYSTSASISKAITQSHETVSRAVNSIEQTTRQVRTVSTLARATDKEIHKFDNTQQADPVVGIYRWVDQIQNVELDRYPHRFLLEFEIPEPGAWTRWLHLNDAARNMINKPPAPLTVNGNPVTATNPLLLSTDITAATYPALAARYMVSGISPLPGPLTVAANIGPANASPAAPRIEFGDQADTTISVPNGYKATAWRASLMYATGGFPGPLTDCHIDIAVGGGPPVRSAPAGVAIMPGTAVQSPGDIFRDNIPTTPIGKDSQGNPLVISQGSIPVGLQTIDVTGYEVNVEVDCQPLDQTYQQWQNDTYGLIVGAYNSMLQAYNDEKAGLTIQQTNLVDANSPDQNVQIIKQELKRQVIEMLIGTRFSGFNAIEWDSTGINPPTNRLAVAANVAPEVQFLEQAFEWEILSYICYPYYWADSGRWKDLAVIQGNDSNFADFLRAGSARVVLPARPGFEDQVNFYTLFGILWGGGPMPAPGDDGYMSIADEIKAQQQRPLDVTPIDTWQVRLPTTLIWLENPIGLPSNPNPTIQYPLPSATSAASPSSPAQAQPTAVAGTGKPRG